MQGHISKSSYTSKQRKEFLRTWTAIGRAHISASHGPDLFQLLDIASSSFVADHDCDDCGPLCTAHPSPAGSTLCTPSSTAAISASKPGATTTSLFGSSGLPGKTQVGSGQASVFGSNLFGGFSSAAPAPPTGNISFGSKPASDTAPPHNSSSTSGAGHVSKSSQCLIPLEVNFFKSTMSNLMRGTSCRNRSVWRTSIEHVRVFLT
jgi:hypothetical protein